MDINKKPPKDFIFSKEKLIKSNITSSFGRKSNNLYKVGDRYVVPIMTKYVELLKFSGQSVEIVAITSTWRGSAKYLVKCPDRSTLWIDI